MSADSSPSSPNPDPSPRGPLARLGVDWTAVIVAGLLVVLAITGLLPSIPFLVT
jgi:hypothetical protein